VLLGYFLLAVHAEEEEKDDDGEDLVVTSRCQNLTLKQPILEDMYYASNEEEENDDKDDEGDDHEHHDVAKLGGDGLSVVELFFEDLLLNLFWVVGRNDLLVVPLAAVELLQESRNQNKENDWDGGEDE